MNGTGKKKHPCAHREHCATRVVISPWHDKTVNHFFSTVDSTHGSSSRHSSHGRRRQIVRNANGVQQQQQPEEIATASPNQRQDANDHSSDKFHAQPRASTHSSSSSSSRDTSSFATAHTGSTKTLRSYGGTDNSNNDDDIDYGILGQRLPQLEDDPASSSASIRTIKPDKKEDKGLDGLISPDNTTATTTTLDGISEVAAPSSQQQSTSSSPQEQHKSSTINEMQAPLSWRSSGAIFMPPAARASFIAREERLMDEGEDVILKQDALLCKKSFGTHGVGDRPTRYKASRETKHLKEEWRQLQVELTSTTLSLYSSPALIWPSRRLEHRVVLNDGRAQHHQQRHSSCHYSNNQDTKKLRLYLLSPLDYTFCIRYPFKSSHDEYVTLTFRGRSVTLSQEWYVALYRVLPDTCKPVCPPWCEVNIPLMDLQVRLPLVDKYTHEIRYDITLDSVKSAVLAVLEKDEDWAKNIESRLGKENLAMCWTRDNRTEWVHWTRSLTDETRRINLVISPQHIEQTHRLELRRVEHTPTDIVFSDYKSMQEPTPVEGFLYRLTTFSGKPIPVGSLSRRRYYFASFDQYLFCTSAVHDLKPPDERCYEKPLTDDTYIARLSPFTARTMGRNNNTTNTLDHEIERRMQLVTEASRVIDLTEISHVQRSFGSSDNYPNDDGDNDNYYSSRNSMLFDVNSDNSLTTSLLRQQRQQNGDTSNNVSPARRSSTRPQNPVLEIVMQNGIVIKLRADSSEACDAWVHHLANLIVYWRAYKEARLNVNAQHDFGDMFEEEFRYGITHKEKGSEFNKPPQVDTRIWSICCFEQCRDIVKTGVMYFQPRARGTFSQKIFVLTANGWLIYYNIYDRAAVTCQPLLAAVHDRKDAVDISSCYLYSSPSPRRPARIFPDGIAAADVNDDSLFSLWKPQTRRVFSPSRQRIAVYKHNRKFFQEEGETWQFLAKNRHEKEEWVWAFNVVIERLLRGK